MNPVVYANRSSLQCGRLSFYVKTFNELNGLFDNNPDFREYPPMDYCHHWNSWTISEPQEYLAMEQYVVRLRLMYKTTRIISAGLSAKLRIYNWHEHVEKKKCLVVRCGWFE